MNTAALSAAAEKAVAAYRALEAAEAVYRAACQELAEHCPHQAGSVISTEGTVYSSQYGMFVSNVRASIDTRRGVPHAYWTLRGMKRTKAGAAHTTASTSHSVDVTPFLATF